jgi:hypothetical protein
MMKLTLATELLNPADNMLPISIFPQCLQMTLYTAEQELTLILRACFKYLLNHIISILVLHHHLVEQKKQLANITSSHTRNGNGSCNKRDNYYLSVNRNNFKTEQTIDSEETEELLIYGVLPHTRHLIQTSPPML